LNYFLPFQIFCKNYEDKDVGELADVLEVIFRIAELREVSKEELEKTRDKKAKERGEFEKNLYLVDTTEKD
jgi:predicted house-cleaning noncanonical NTP pyrophosphatase (MazG superfamily)